jgi:hypothetical protein
MLNRHVAWKNKAKAINEKSHKLQIDCLATRSLARTGNALPGNRYVDQGNRIWPAILRHPYFFPVIPAQAGIHEAAGEP